MIFFLGDEVNLCKELSLLKESLPGFAFPEVLSGVGNGRLQGGELLFVVLLHPGQQVSVHLPLEVFADGGVEGGHVVLGDRRHQLASSFFVVLIEKYYIRRVGTHVISYRVSFASENPLGDVKIRYAGKTLLLHVFHRHPDLLLSISEIDHRSGPKVGTFNTHSQGGGKIFHTQQGIKST